MGKASKIKKLEVAVRVGSLVHKVKEQAQAFRIGKLKRKIRQLKRKRNAQESEISQLEATNSQLQDRHDSDAVTIGDLRRNILELEGV